MPLLQSPRNDMSTTNQLENPKVGEPRDNPIDITDIRRPALSNSKALENDIINGLLQPQHKKTLPSLLLWDEEGQRLFNKIIFNPRYYPYRAETNLLAHFTVNIARTIVSSAPDIIIEFGSPSTRKTIPLLFALDRLLTTSITYYTLDVDPVQLEKSLLDLHKLTELRNIKVRGLVGTYDDGAHWLAQHSPQPPRTAILWFGSTICNFDKEEGGELLGSFLKASDADNFCGALIAVDGCQDGERVNTAYNLPDGDTSNRILHAVDAASQLLSKDCANASEVENFFNRESWCFQGGCSREEGLQYDTCVAPLRDVSVTLRRQRIYVEVGERVRVITSRKWTVDEIVEVSKRQGLVISETWKDKGINYGLYWLQPNSEEHCDEADIDAHRQGMRAR
ncbi:hypothetical protein B0T16DRAFT_188134 [Cercophora newfieldiana]|uniref:Histidine-specific methyltransferase SAM-dependent domain-containing protein n=1 Tax=Cercophora newfieldiana TaxID=92897 RepID=A0AA40CNP3_9PEZI|nr:hypothetical protein B0T16DRAFT_188134 [Cercophora newfieldiana]